MKLTKWFSIDHEGQPSFPGMYDVAYSWQYEDDSEDFDRRYWDGVIWKESETGRRLSFGNEDTNGERWRGLAEKP